MALKQIKPENEFENALQNLTTLNNSALKGRIDFCSEMVIRFFKIYNKNSEMNTFIINFENIFNNFESGIIEELKKGEINNKNSEKLIQLGRDSMIEIDKLINETFGNVPSSEYKEALKQYLIMGYLSSYFYEPSEIKNINTNERIAKIGIGVGIAGIVAGIAIGSIVGSQIANEGKNTNMEEISKLYGGVTGGLTALLFSIPAGAILSRSKKELNEARMDENLRRAIERSEQQQTTEQINYQHTNRFIENIKGEIAKNPSIGELIPKRE